MIENFGETYTQDETYYISVAKEDAKVYVGLNENINALEFKQKLLESEQNGTEVDIEKYVHSVEVKPNDLILITNGTVHLSCYMTIAQIKKLQNKKAFFKQFEN